MKGAHYIHVQLLTNGGLSGNLTSHRENTMPHERIEVNPGIMDGKPVIRSTRVPVELVLRKLGAGMSIEAILADHPRLTQDDMRAAQAFAADYLADEDIVYG
jgi:uncharacterized protein (DUF433 family)